MNAISPDVETPHCSAPSLSRSLTEQPDNQRAALDVPFARIPLGRYVSAGETGGLIAFLVSAEAAQITGATSPPTRDWRSSEMLRAGSRPIHLETRGEAS